MDQPRKLVIDFSGIAVNADFLASNPLSTDWRGFFGPLERTRLHYLLGQRDPVVGKALDELSRFFLGNGGTSAGAADEDAVNRALVEEGRQLKEQFRRCLRLRRYIL